MRPSPHNRGAATGRARARRAVAMLFAWAWVGWFPLPVAAGESAEAPQDPSRVPPPAAFHAADPHLAELIDELLEANPEIHAARERWLSRKERVPQASALPDANVTYRYFAQGPETRVGPQRQALEISQGLPWFGKRAERTRRSEHDAAGAGWNVRDLERALVARLKRSYFEAAYLQEALAVNAEERELLRRFEQIALTRYATGQGIQQSVIKVQTEISRLADRRAALQERLEIESLRIARLIGRPGTGLRLQPIPLASLDLEPGELPARPGPSHPSVLAAQEAIRADEAWLRRSRLAGRPDFRLGLGFVDVGEREDGAGVINPPEDNGQDIWSLTVGIRVPLSRRANRSGVVEARQSVRARERLLDSARQRLQVTVREAILRLESIGERADLYRDVIVPQAEQSLASAEAAYTNDRLGFLDLLEAQRVLFQARLTRHRLAADQWIALADLEYGLGRAYPAQGSGA